MNTPVHTKTTNLLLLLIVMGSLVAIMPATAAEIIAINTSWSVSPENLRLFEERYDTNYSSGFDFGELITDRYQVTAVPAEFIVDVNGVIRYRNGVPKYVMAQPVHSK